jgi:hypothetical protein
MLSSEERQVWSHNGYRYAQSLMADNDGSAEAKILLALAQHKRQQQVEASGEKHAAVM